MFGNPAPVRREPDPTAAPKESLGDAKGRRGGEWQIRQTMEAWRMAIIAESSAFPYSCQNYDMIALLPRAKHQEEGDFKLQGAEVFERLQLENCPCQRFPDNNERSISDVRMNSGRQTIAVLETPVHMAAARSNTGPAVGHTSAGISGTAQISVTIGDIMGH